MVCGEKAEIDHRHPERNRIHSVITLPMRHKLVECCDKREDAWTSEVQNRLCGCIDLVAAEVIYHANFYSQFLLNKENSLSLECVGKPEDKGMLHWFQMWCQWLVLDANAELYTLAELHARMAEFSSGSNVYTYYQKVITEIT